jgi:hypothetical protein
LCRAGISEIKKGYQITANSSYGFWCKTRAGKWGLYYRITSSEIAEVLAIARASYINTYLFYP